MCGARPEKFDGRKNKWHTPASSIKNCSAPSLLTLILPFLYPYPLLRAYVLQHVASSCCTASPARRSRCPAPPMLPGSNSYGRGAPTATTVLSSRVSPRGTLWTGSTATMAVPTCSTRRLSSLLSTSAGTPGSRRRRRISPTQRRRTSLTRRRWHISLTRQWRISPTAAHLSDDLNHYYGNDEEAALILQPDDPDLDQAGGGT
jgi:hypothetical protein